MSQRGPKIEFDGITKKYGNFFANENINLQFEAGKIHAIAGENGAGKSTLMKIFFGMEQPDSGQIRVDGNPVRFHSPREAIATGLGMVQQHFLMAESESVLDNILFGKEPIEKGQLFSILPSGGQFIDRKSALEKISNVAKSANSLDFSVEANLLSPIGEFEVGQIQQIEILKLLYRSVDILILDEPTAVLAPTSIEPFYHQISQLAKLGKTILIVTHKLDEIINYCHTVSVLRAGKLVSSMPVSQTNCDQIASDMVGKTFVKQNFNLTPFNASSKPVISVKNLKISKFPDSHLNLDLFPGQIVGIAGVDGNGQAEILDYFCDVVRKKQVTGGYVAADRHSQGLLLEESLWQNMVLGLNHSPQFINAFGFMKRKSAQDFTQSCINEYGIKCGSLHSVVGSLSGGNQQKLLIARELALNPEVAVVAQPTRGVDIGAIEWIHAKLIERRNNGCALLLVSSELQELFSLSDVLHVLYKGKMVGTFLRGQYDELKVGRLMGGKQ
jgi:simple sugar transport system ATP-binding protein